MPDLQLRLLGFIDSKRSSQERQALGRGCGCSESEFRRCDFMGSASYPTMMHRLRMNWKDEMFRKKEYGENPNDLSTFGQKSRARER
jgi:hypothetical protein